MKKVWLEHYQDGVPKTIDPNEEESLVSFFEKACEQYAERTAYVNLGTNMTYAELEKKSRQCALFLRSLGLNRGSRVAIMMPNLLQYPVVLFGILRAGMIVVNTNPLYTADELAYQLQDAEAEAIIVLANFASTVEKALPNLPNLKHIVITQVGDFFPSLKRMLVNAVVKHIKKMVPSYALPQAFDLNTLLEAQGDKPLLSANLIHQDIAFLQYTGGTTGIAKGAMLTHGNMIANVLQAYAWIKPLLDVDEIVVTALPLYHVFSLTANCLAFIKIGAKNILITNPRDFSHFIKEIKNSKFTVLTGVNTLFNALLNDPNFKKVDFSKLKVTLSGGMALQKSVALRWQEVTQTPVLEAYGLTETCPAVTINPLYLKEYNGSIGFPLPSTDISIRNEEGEELGFDEPGELCIKGPQVMAGYWQKPNESAAIMTIDGFLKTGDIAKVDEQGFVYIVDRKKDMIIVSGFNVYPNEVEQILSLHPKVKEVGVVGHINADGNEAVKACVVKRDPSLTEEELIAYSRLHLTPYKVPKIVQFYDELPKTNVGKILRRALRS